jgi:ribonuclease HI
MKCTIIVDASYCAETQLAGWAAWIRIGEGKGALIKSSGVFRDKLECNNTAELLAAANAVYIATKAGATRILVQTDSLTAVAAINAAKAEWRLAVCDFAKCSNISARHVKGHTMSREPKFYCNRWCDAEAKHQLRRVRRRDAE